MTKVTSQEKDKIAGLINVTKSINKIYDVLAYLEKDGQKNTADYNKHLSYLNMAIEAEEEIYNDLREDKDKCIEIFYYLYETNPDSMILSEFERIVQSNYEELYLHRIFNRLKNIIVTGIKSDYDKFIIDATKRFNSIKDANGFIEYREELSEKHIKLLFENNKYCFAFNKESYEILLTVRQKEFLYRFGNVETEYFRSLPQDCKVKSLIENDLYLNYLIYLEEAINDQLDSDVRDELIDSKYNLFFVNENLEGTFVPCGFSIPNDNILVSEEINLTIYSILEDYYNTFETDIVSSNIRDQIFGLYEIFDPDYDIKSNRTEAKHRLCLLKANLLFLDSTLSVVNLVEKIQKRGESDTTISYRLILDGISKTDETIKQLKIRE